MEFLLIGRLMLAAIRTQPKRWVFWAIAASLAAALAAGWLESALGEPVTQAPRSSLARSSAASARATRVKAPSPTPGREARGDGREPMVFVVGPNRSVRFRIDLRRGTVATPRASSVLDSVVDLALSDDSLFLCRVAAAVEREREPEVVGFDLRTGERTKAALAMAGAASVDAGFCKGRRWRSTPASDALRQSIALQMSLERQATILPSVSNGDLQSSFLISSRHSLSSFTTTPPGQS